MEASLLTRLSSENQEQLANLEDLLQYMDDSSLLGLIGVDSSALVHQFSEWIEDQTQEAGSER